MKRVVYATVFAASVFTASPANAQSNPPVRLGVVAGASFATLGGSDVDDANTRTGFMGGASLVVPLQGRLSLEVNGLYAQKGAKGSDESESVIFKLDYVELPVLIRYDFAESGVRPFVSGGVSLAYQTACKARGAAAGIVAEIGCSTLKNDPDIGLEVKKFDAGVAIGGGLDFPLADDRMVTLGARYTWGLIDVVKDLTVRNRAFQLYAGFSFPLR